MMRSNIIKAYAYFVNGVSLILTTIGFFYLLQTYSDQLNKLEFDDFVYLKGSFLFLFPAMIIYFFLSMDPIKKKIQNLLFVIVLAGFGMIGIGRNMVNFISGTFGIVALISLVWLIKDNKS